MDLPQIALCYPIVLNLALLENEIKATLTLINRITQNTSPTFSSPPRKSSIESQSSRLRLPQLFERRQAFSLLYFFEISQTYNSRAVDARQSLKYFSLFTQLLFLSFLRIKDRLKYNSCNKLASSIEAESDTPLRFNQGLPLKLISKTYTATIRSSTKQNH